MKDKVLIIFVKYPEPGKVKTRLAESIGLEKAALLYRELSRTVIALTRSSQYRRIVFTAGEWGEDVFASWLGEDLEFVPQKGRGLGERMKNAFSHVFQAGAGKAVIIGTDCLLVNSEVILEVFEKLNEIPVVIGPTEDGGYYLLGLSSLQEDIFKDVDWSTEKVLSQTMAKLKAKGLDVTLTKEGFDIDREEDLLRLEKEMSFNEVSQRPEYKDIKTLTSILKNK